MSVTHIVDCHTPKEYLLFFSLILISNKFVREKHYEIII